MKDDEKVQPATLTVLFPLCFMTEAEQEMLSEELSLRRGKRGQTLIECGDADNKALYVLKGRIKVESDNGESKIYEDNAPQFKNPISFAKPHKYTVTCLSAVEYFRLENHIIANLLERKNALINQSAGTIDDHLQDNSLYTEIYKDLIEDKLILPTLPKIALGVRKAIENDMPVRKIELLIQADPALASLLIKTANSVLYRTRNSASTIEQAIMRMGLRTVKNLVTSYSLKHLFNTKNKNIQQRMHDLWIHTAEVAAVTYVLAKQLNTFDPEQALLIGLLHNVGILPVLGYADKYPEIINDEEMLDTTINSLKAEIGTIILSKWQFPQEFITAAKESENWYRDDATQADYCDLVMVAKLHTFIGREQQHSQLPHLFEIPAFHKLGLDKDSPNKGLSIIADAKEQISEVRRLLSI